MKPRTRRRAPAVPLALLVLLAPPRLAAQEEGEGRPQVVLESATGELTRRPLAGFETRDLGALGATLVRFEGLERPPLSAAGRERAVLTLAGGGRIEGALRGGEGELLVLELLAGAILRVPIESMRSVVFPGRIPADRAESPAPPELGDRLYLYRSSGLDRVDGAVETFTAEGVRFDGSLGSKLYPWSEVSALFIEVFEDEAAAPETAAGLVTVDLIDGSRLGGELVKLDERALDLRTAGGRGLRLPLPVVSELFVDDGRLAFLSDLEPAEAIAAVPFGDELGMRWPHRRDRSVTGGPLRAGGAIWTRGLGVHAPSRLTWALDGAWRSLRGLVAVDDEVLTLAARGSVRFRVLADGQERWVSPILRGGDPPLEMPAIDLAGVERLTLEVDPATDLFIADRADWLHLVLRR